MTEVDVLGTDEIHDSTLNNQHEFFTYPPSTDTSSPLSVTSPSICSPNHDVTEDVIRRRLRSSMTVNANRGSFYTSGTLSACTSREHSPVRMYTVRKITPYPVAPPSMIITPARATSVDRTVRSFSEMDIEELRDKLTQIPMLTTGQIAVDKLEKDRKCVKVKRSIKMADNRSSIVTPRTTRRQFYDDYPRHFTKLDQLPPISPKADITEKAVNCQEQPAKNWVTLIPFNTLPFFKKKHPQKTSRNDILGVSVSSEESLLRERASSPGIPTMTSPTIPTSSEHVTKSTGRSLNMIIDPLLKRRRSRSATRDSTSCSSSSTSLMTLHSDIVQKCKSKLKSSHK